MPERTRQARPNESAAAGPAADAAPGRPVVAGHAGLTHEQITRTTARAHDALRLVCASLPHLAGLAHAVRVTPDTRVPTAAIAASGRLLVNPDFLAGLTLPQATFVMAHELLHLCLESHDRGRGADGQVFNWAHDYIINDILANELREPVPAGGLAYPGARFSSAEQIVELIKNGKVRGPRPQPRPTMRAALEDAGLLPGGPGPVPGTGDVLSADMERRMFPDDPVVDEERARRRVRDMAAKAAGLGVLKQRIDQADADAQAKAALAAGASSVLVGALRGLYAPPWELVLQQWLESVAPGPRTYARPSRRDPGQADRTDAVLPGRQRVGWTLHIVLDTSGSMADQISRVLGLVATFCESVGVQSVHILQCDVDVTKDEFVDPDRLAEYQVFGYGGSNMGPAMRRLAEDPEVQAALVVTDGAIDYPPEPMPYDVLWALVETADSVAFRPAYGRVLAVPPEG